jgi:hypothetical protein
MLSVDIFRYYATPYAIFNIDADISLSFRFHCH